MTELDGRVSLREFIDYKFQALENLLDERARADRIALEKASATVDSRLESMNEFRASLKDQTASFVTRQEIESIRSVINAELQTLQRLVFIGIGALAAVQVILGLVVK